MLAALTLLVLPGLVISAGLKDILSQTIPNAICVALAAAFVPAVFIAGLPAGVVGLHGLVATIVLLVGMGLFAGGWLGGGDAKLMAASALWLGPGALPLFFIATALSGGALCLGLVALRSVWLRPVTTQGPAWLDRLASPGAPAPYGVAICIGALAAFTSCDVAIGLMRLI